MATGKLDSIPDLEQRLSRMELSPARASRVTGVTRRTVNKLLEGKGVRRSAVRNLITGLSEHLGRDQIAEHFSDIIEEVFESGNVVGLDGSPINEEFSVSARLEEAYSLLDEALETLDEVHRETLQKPEVVKHIQLFDVDQKNRFLQLQLELLRERIAHVRAEMIENIAKNTPPPTG